MNALALLAVVMIAIWLAAIAFFKIVGFGIHLLLVAAVVMLVAWAIRKFSGTSGGQAV